MPPKLNREERQLQRQRGAGKRKVRNATGFELVLPGQDAVPLEDRKSGRTRRTLQPEVLPPQTSSRRTRASDVLPPQRSTRRTPALEETAPLEPRKSGRSRKTPQPAPLPTQRSTRGTPAAEVLPPRPSTRKTPTPTPTGKRKRPGGEATFDIQESPAFPDANDAVPNTAGEQPNKKQRIIGEEDVDGAVEDQVTEEEESAGAPAPPDADEGTQGPSGSNSGAKKRKKRKSIGQQSTKKAKTRTSQVQKKQASEVKPEPMSPTAHGDSTSRLEDFAADTEDQAQIQQELAGAAEAGLRDSLVGDTFEEEATERSQRRKRKSIGQQQRKRAKPIVSKNVSKGGITPEAHMYSSQVSTPDTIYLKASEEEEDGEEGQQEQDEDGEEEEQDEDAEEGEAKTLSDVPSKAQPHSGSTKSKRKKRKSIGQNQPRKKKTSAGAAKAPIIIEKPPPSQRTSNTTAPKPRPASTKPRAPPSNTIPITIYRPSPQPPASASDSNTDEDEDPLTAPLPPATKTINAIDVLAQISRELIHKAAASSTLSSRSQQTVKIYGRELETRMQQLGQALSTNTALGKRVRGMKGEERKLKSALREARSEGEVVREKMEEARKMRDGRRLAELLVGIEQVVRRGWEREEGG